MAAGAPTANGNGHRERSRLRYIEIAQTLRDKAKLTPEQAEGVSRAFAETLNEDLATKTDLREGEFRLEAKIEGATAEIVKWMFGTIGFQTLIVLGAVVALARILR